MTEETIFHEALLQPTGERNAYLEEACAGKPELLAAVKSLLAAHEASSGFLKQPPEELARTDGPKPITGWSDVTGAYTPDPEGLNPSSGGVSFLPVPGPGLVIAGRYSLVEKIGEGGMGVVWVADQTEPIKRKVALKVIKTGMDSRSVLARFEQERQALALMDHPNIARVLDGGMTPTGQPFFVMELVNGLPLNKFCDEARLPLRERLELFVPICQAIQHAHQKGIIHRDLKPANILVTLVDGRPIPKVIDFGVAKATGDKIIDDSISTHFGAVVGTLEYMSPEQAGLSSEGIDTRSDIYSLGVILYELLTGLRPFDSIRLKKAALTEVIRIIREEDPSRPSTRLSTDESLPSLAAMRRIEPRKLMSMLRGELDWVVMKCLEKSRDRRYETANGLARDIQHYLADEPVEARPPSAGYRFGKFIRRNKGVVIATTLVFLTLAGGIIGTSMGMIRAEHNRAEAETAWGEEALRAEGERKAKERESLQRESAEKARERESLQRERAEKARDRTRQALDAMTSSVTGDSLTSQQEVTEEQEKFLSEVLTYYQEFAGENQEDEKSRALSAMAAYRVGMIEIRLGRKKQGFEDLLQALKRFESLESDFPDFPGYLQAVGICHNDLGNILKDLGKWTESEHHYNKALIHKEKLASIVLGRPEDENDLALSLNNLGILFTRIGKHTDARETFQKALAIQEKLNLDNPVNPVFRTDLSRTQHNLGFLLTEIRKWPEAFEHYHRAFSIRKNLVSEFPTVTSYKQLLARTHNNLGLVLKHQGKRQEANEQYLLAKAIFDNLVARFPGTPLYREELASSHTNLGGLFLANGELSHAEEQFRLAQGLLETLVSNNPIVPEYRQSLAHIHYNLGLVLKKLGRRADAETQFRKALVFLEKLVKEIPFLPEYRKDLANIHSEIGIVALKESVKKEHYLTAQALRETLVSEFPGNPVYRENLAISHVNMGMLFRDSGKPTESRTEYNEALRLQEQLFAEFPTEPGPLQDLAQTHQKIATNLQESGNGIEAEIHYRKALLPQEKLVVLFPKNPEYRHDLGLTTNNLGILLANLRRGDEAQEPYNRANALFAQLVTENPKIPDYRKSLASNHNNQGLLLASQDKMPQAEEQYRKALDIQEKLVADFPTELTYAIDLGGGYSNMGGMVFTAGRSTEGLDWFTKAIQTLTTVHSKDPGLLTATKYLRNSFSNRARGNDRIKNHGQAILDWDKAIELSTPAEQQVLRPMRALSKARAGHHLEAVAEVSDLTRSNNWNANRWYDFACIYSVASAKIADKKQMYADEAIESLKKAVKAGYSNAANLEKDADLVPLRERGDFKALLESLKKQQDQKPRKKS